MAKNTIADLDVTATNNTDVLGQSTAGSAAVSTIDTMIQNLMGLIARFYADFGGTTAPGGSANAITLTSASTYQALEDGLIVALKAGASNSGATTLNVDGLGAKAARLPGDIALTGGEILEDGIYLFRYESSYDTAAGAWVLLNRSLTAATTSAAGIVELATLAETLAGTDTSRAVAPANLYFPTGHLYGLTLTNAAGDATNDITIAAGTARDASDSYNYVLGSAYTKQIDAAWALGSAAGGLDTGSVGNSRYAIWGIGRSDTRVCDVLFSTSFSAPTMPANYDFKVLIGEFTRAGGVNGTPLWYGPRRAGTGYDGITLGSPTASTYGTSIDFTGIPAWAKRVNVMFNGTSLSGTSNYLLQIGAGSVTSTGYVSSAIAALTSSATSDSSSTSGMVLTDSLTAGYGLYGAVVLYLENPASGKWVSSGTLTNNNGTRGLTSGGAVTLSGALDRVRLTTTNGTDTFDAGEINISWE